MNASERWLKPTRDKPMDETAAPYTMATWEYPRCLRCDGECIFSDCICAQCWRVFTEETA